MESKILRILRNTNGYVSGQEICRQLDVSRTTVWNVINKLKQEGYGIEAISNKGYCLTGLPDRITKEACLSQLNTKWAGTNYCYYDEVDSTNNKARQLGEEQAPHGTLVTAERQTAGKGRRGRTWNSPEKSSVFMTLLLRPEIEPLKASMLTLVAALSVMEGIEKTTKMQTQIKWPNDIVKNGKKICGILTEMSADMDQINYVVIGMGINCNLTEFPDDIKDKATSVCLETGQMVMRSTLIVNIMEQFEKHYQAFLQCGNLSRIKKAYEDRLVNRDRQVQVLSPQKEYKGISRGINENGELLVETEDGKIHAVFSGEVSVRGIYGYV